MIEFTKAAVATAQEIVPPLFFLLCEIIAYSALQFPLGQVLVGLNLTFSLITFNLRVRMFWPHFC
jgi:hypothetical protein